MIILFALILIIFIILFFGFDKQYQSKVIRYKTRPLQYKYFNQESCIDNSCGEIYPYRQYDRTIPMTNVIDDYTKYVLNRCIKVVDAINILKEVFRGKTKYDLTEEDRDYLIRNDLSQYFDSMFIIENNVSICF